jgi:hypothetical protein
MIHDDKSECLLKCDDLAGLNDARYRHDLITLGTVKMVVMIRDRFQASASVIKDDLAEEPICNQFFRRPEQGRKIAIKTLLRETLMQLFKRPGVAVRLAKGREDGSGDASFASHGFEKLDEHERFRKPLAKLC